MTKYFLEILCILMVLLNAVIGETYIYKNGKRYRMGEPTNCKITCSAIKNINEFQNAIDNAKCGDTITLCAITYFGSVVINGKNDNDCHESIAIEGTNLCNNNTKIIGSITITNNGIGLSINNIVFVESEKTITINNSRDVKLNNLVLNDVTSPININNCDEIQLINLVMKKVAGNAINAISNNKLEISQMVLENVGRKSIVINGQNNEVLITGVVINNIGDVAIDMSNVSNSQITNNVITCKGEACIKVLGDNSMFMNNVLNGFSNHGIKINGCGHSFANNICNLKGYCLYFEKNNLACTNDIAPWTNMNSNGRLSNIIRNSFPF